MLSKTHNTSLTTYHQPPTTASPDHDLGAQQNHLASLKFDLRISNLAKFILKNIQTNPVETCHGMSLQSLKLLDVGAGNGLFLKFFKTHGFDVTGYELEDELVANMKKDPDLKGVSISQTDITKTKGRPEYDVVIASDVIEHIKEHELAVKNLWSFVAPGGRLVITVPAHMHLYGKRDEAWGHYRRYDRRSLLSIVESLESGVLETLTFWNLPGYFIYFFFEKILKKQVDETARYSNSLPSRIIRWIFNTELEAETAIGYVPWGLTLIAIVRKEK